MTAGSPASLAAVAPGTGRPLGRHRAADGRAGGADRRERDANDAFLALPDLPHYFSVFVWAATFGGFALLIVYLLMSLGAFRGLADHPNRAGLWIAVILGASCSPAAAIFGSLLQGDEPAAAGSRGLALAWFVVGIVVMFGW